MEAVVQPTMWFTLLKRTGIVLAAVLWGGGSLLLAIFPHPESTQTCKTVLEHAPLNHLARCDHDARVSASTQDEWSNHPALWAIDGNPGDSTLEKWMSREKDSQPWLLVEWPASRLISKVIIHHAGSKESNKNNTIDFDIQVRKDGIFHTLIEVRDNTEPITEHIFTTTNTDAVRIWIRNPSRIDKRARIYEIEVHAA